MKKETKKQMFRLALFVLILFLFSKSTFAQRVARLERCNMALPEEILKSDMTFSEVFSFKISSKGRPKRLKRVFGKYIELEEVKKCVKSWRFHGFEINSRVTVSMGWRPLGGWTAIVVRSAEFCKVLDDETKDCEA